MSFTGQKQERQYEAVEFNIQVSTQPSAALFGGGFRIVQNKGKESYRLEAKKEMLHMTLQQLIDKRQAEYEAYKAKQGGGQAQSNFQPAPAAQGFQPPTNAQGGARF